MDCIWLSIVISSKPSKRSKVTELLTFRDAYTVVDVRGTVS